MVSASVVDQIIQSLAFEVEAVPPVAPSQVNTHSIPLNLRIKVKMKENHGMRGKLSDPKYGHPEVPKERIRLISSDQTIMSFDVSMETDFAKKPKRKLRKSFFGVCLGTQYDDDDSTYLPSTLYNGKMADGNNISSKSDGVIKLNSTLLKIKYDSAEFQAHKRKPDILGKCKPGGCLDPPFGEEKYAYKPYQKQKLKKNIPIKEATPAPAEIIQHDELSYALRINSKESLNLSNPKTRLKIDNDSILNLYLAKTASPDLKRSDSIITYPPETSSTIISQEKPLTKKVIKEEKQRKSHNESIDVLFSYPRMNSRLSGNSGNYFPKKEKRKNNEEPTNSDSIDVDNNFITRNLLLSTTLSIQERPSSRKNTNTSKDEQDDSTSPNLSNLSKPDLLRQPLTETLNISHNHEMTAIRKTISQHKDHMLNKNKNTMLALQGQTDNSLKPDNEDNTTDTVRSHIEIITLNSPKSSLKIQSSDDTVNRSDIYEATDTTNNVLKNVNHTVSTNDELQQIISPAQKGLEETRTLLEIKNMYNIIEYNEVNDAVKKNAPEIATTNILEPALKLQPSHDIAKDLNNKVSKTAEITLIQDHMIGTNQLRPSTLSVQENKTENKIKPEIHCINYTAKSDDKNDPLLTETEISASNLIRPVLQIQRSVDSVVKDSNHNVLTETTQQSTGNKMKHDIDFKKDITKHSVNSCESANANEIASSLTKTHIQTQSSEYLPDIFEGPEVTETIINTLMNNKDNNIESINQTSTTALIIQEEPKKNSIKCKLDTNSDTTKYSDKVNINDMALNTPSSKEVIKSLLQTQSSDENNVLRTNQLSTTVVSIKKKSSNDKIISELHDMKDSKINVDSVENYDFHKEILNYPNDTKLNELTSSGIIVSNFIKANLQRQSSVNDVNGFNRYSGSRNSSLSIGQGSKSNYFNNKNKLSNQSSHTDIPDGINTGIEHSVCAGIKYETKNENTVQNNNSTVPGNTIIEENETQSEVPSLPWNYDEVHTNQSDENSRILSSDDIKSGKNGFHESCEILSGIPSNFNNLDNKTISNQLPRLNLKENEQKSRSQSDSFRKLSKRASRDNIIKQYSLENKTITMQSQHLSPHNSNEQIIIPTVDCTPFTVVDSDSGHINELHKNTCKPNKGFPEYNVITKGKNLILANETTSILSFNQQQNNQNLIAENESHLLNEFKVNAIGLKNENRGTGNKSLQFSDYQNSKECLDQTARDSKMYNVSIFRDNLDDVKENPPDETVNFNDNLDSVRKEKKQNLNPDYMPSVPMNNEGNIEDSRLVDITVTKDLKDEKFILRRSMPSQDKLENIFSTELTESKTTLIQSLKIQKTTDSEKYVKLSSGSKSFTKNDVVYFDLAFVTYLNEKKERTLKTIETLKVQNLPEDDSITVIQNRLGPNTNEIRFDLGNHSAIQIIITRNSTPAIDRDSEIDSEELISGLQKDNDNLNIFDKELGDIIADNEIREKVLHTVYEQELIPLEKTIKNLKKEIDIIFGQQMLLLEELCKAMQANKPIRLFRVNQGCGCWRK